MSIHEQVLDAALRICRGRAGWRFRPLEIVQALPHVHAGSVRTHVVSRCCVNAPVHHPHRWDYFERVGRGLYEIRATYRRRARRRRPTGTARRAVTGHPGATEHRSAGERILSERPASYRPSADSTPRDTVHAVVIRSREWYVAECLEIAVVTQGHTLDELTANLRDAVDLHLDGDDAAALGLLPSPRIAVTYER
jgi:predicted RNase H-like HicB family nuclease